MVGHDPSLICLFLSWNILIIPHFGGFVKRFFKTFLDFFLLCSRHNPSLLQRNGTGSHLYPPNLHTLGSRQSAETERGKSYIALVGFGSSPLLSLTSFVSLLYHTRRGLSRGFLTFFKVFFDLLGIAPLIWYLYYSTLGAICQGDFSNFFEKLFPNCVLPLLAWVFPTG